MIREIRGWVCLILVVVLLHITDSRLAFGGAVGLISGNWTRWGRRVREIMVS